SAPGIFSPTIDMEYVIGSRKDGRAGRMLACLGKYFAAALVDIELAPRPTVGPSKGRSTPNATSGRADSAEANELWNGWFMRRPAALPVRMRHRLGVTMALD